MRTLRQLLLFGGRWTPARAPSLGPWHTVGPQWCFTDAAGTVPAGAGDPVRVWKDRSGNGYDLTQATLASRPVMQVGAGGRWKLTFDGSNDRMTSAYQPARPHSIGVRFTVNTAGGVHDFASGNVARLWVESSLYNWYSGDYLTADVVPLVATPVTSVVGFAASGTFVRFNGVAKTIAHQASSSPAGGLVVGDYGTPPATPLDGDIYELVCTTALLSAADAARLEAYLAL